MYLKYHTDAVVLGTIDSGDADRTYKLLTRDVGLVFATGKSVRTLKSKLRYALQPFSLSEVSLVRGNGAWRVASAAPRTSIFFSLVRSGKYESMSALARVLAVIERLVRGEEKNARLYEIVEHGYRHCASNTLSSDETLTLECLLLLRILHDLGYLKREMRFTPFLQEPTVSMDVLTQFRGVRGIAIVDINEALAASQL